MQPKKGRMAKEERREPPIQVNRAYCGKRVPANEAKSFGEFDKKREVMYFCSVRCSLAKLFGIVEKSHEFKLGIENCK